MEQHEFIRFLRDIVDQERSDLDAELDVRFQRLTRQLESFVGPIRNKLYENSRIEGAEFIASDGIRALIFERHAVDYEMLDVMVQLATGNDDERVVAELRKKYKPTWSRWVVTRGVGKLSSTFYRHSPYVRFQLGDVQFVICGFNSRFID